MFTNVFTTVLAITATLMAATTASPIVAGATPGEQSALSAGRFTYYTPGLGACGQSHSSSELVVALNHVDFDPYTPNGNPNNNSLCGRRIRASYGGKSVDVTVVDRCPACNAGDLDLNPTAFQALASLDVGVIQGTWEWI
ncbi:RlpA-like double-psi beta-barrel-protein domain-containing protein-containing protein [Chaetomidium leptoderma]|uniref:RlpA-like double-psi beta-barrel-protein domain-containing protein-containing protein n=1 Tax=Chaetomidium leptoderma TaxID=669021 RepID=A0AAN6VBX7_9PEZI|nr:RlpA-like double-psi beta-barrel-protein domain-containing protein-containing protein [Chaetomidium leptoderma]